MRPAFRGRVKPVHANPWPNECRVPGQMRLPCDWTEALLKDVPPGEPMIDVPANAEVVVELPAHGKTSRV
jgi:hypothetical protein